MCSIWKGSKRLSKKDFIKEMIKKNKKSEGKLEVSLTKNLRDLLGEQGYIILAA
jgi:hypothetical protein